MKGKIVKAGRTPSILPGPQKTMYKDGKEIFLMLDELSVHKIQVSPSPSSPHVPQRGNAYESILLMSFLTRL